MESLISLGIACKSDRSKNFSGRVLTASPFSPSLPASPLGPGGPVGPCGPYIITNKVSKRKK